MEKEVTESAQFAERVLELRNNIMHSLPDESATEEVILAGLTLFFQAAYWWTDDNHEMVEKMTRDCMELAQKMNESNADTVH